METLINLVDFSVQQLIDCDPYDNGCSGGWFFKAWEYLQSDGSNSAEDYGYTGNVSNLNGHHMLQH